jgi:hypothetical protein
MASIDARLRKLEKQRDEDKQVVILFGDDPVPEGTPPNAMVFRFDDEDRGA